MARSILRTAHGLIARHVSVDLVVGRLHGDLIGEAPPQARIIELEPAARWKANAYALAAYPADSAALLKLRFLGWKPPGKTRLLPSLVRYFREARPEAVWSATAPLNLIAVWARRLARIDSPVIVSVHNQLTVRDGEKHRWRYDCPPELLRQVYLHADAIAAVSDGVANELVTHARIPRSRISIVYNPVAGPHIQELMHRPVDHPWFADGQPPVIIGVGKLSPAKDFPTLIRAFARLRRERPIRLVIFGDLRIRDKEAKYRADLERLPKELDIEKDVDFAGFTDNPFAYMSRAAAFVLSSAWEGLPTVLIEALACGCPVVSTDCPSGPSEILENGRFGPLVPVGNDEALAAAIQSVLDNPSPPAALKYRADLFTGDRILDLYMKLMFEGGENSSITQ